MTEPNFTPGAIFTRDNPLCDVWPPSWLRPHTKIEYQHRCESDGRWGPANHGAWTDADWKCATAIRLDASDIVYRCITWNEAHPDRPPMWPWYLRGQCPPDWAYGRVLLSDGTTAGVVSTSGYWTEGYDGVYVIGYQRRPTTSLPEPAEEGKPEPFGYWVEQKYADPVLLRKPAYIPEPSDLRTVTPLYAKPIEGNEFVPAYSAVETAKHYAELAGMVAVTPVTRGEAARWWLQQERGYRDLTRFLDHLGVIRPDPSPLDLAKAAHPTISPEIVESIAAIVKGEAK